MFDGDTPTTQKGSVHGGVATMLGACLEVHGTLGSLAFLMLGFSWRHEFGSFALGNRKATNTTEPTRYLLDQYFEHVEIC